MTEPPILTDAEAARLLELAGWTELGDRDAAVSFVRELARIVTREVVRGAVESALEEIKAQGLDRGGSQGFARGGPVPAPAPSCGECSGTGWFTPTPVHGDGWPCRACGGTGRAGAQA